MIRQPWTPPRIQVRLNEEQTWYTIDMISKERHHMLVVWVEHALTVLARRNEAMVETVKSLQDAPKQGCIRMLLHALVSILMSYTTWQSRETFQWIDPGGFYSIPNPSRRVTHRNNDNWGLLEASPGLAPDIAHLHHFATLQRANLSRSGKILDELDNLADKIAMVEKRPVNAAPSKIY